MKEWGAKRKQNGKNDEYILGEELKA